MHETRDEAAPNVAYSQLPEVAYDRHNLPEVTYDRHILPEVVPNSQYTEYGSGETNLPQKIELDGSVSHGRDYRSAPLDATKIRYHCGMTKRVFWLVILAVALVLAAIVGGVAGGVASSHKSSAKTKTSANRHRAFFGSKLAALNWTDENDIVCRAVFYQTNGALFVSQTQDTGSSPNSTWTHVNITDQFVRDVGILALNPRNGTPLAAAATPWRTGNSAPLERDDRVCYHTLLFRHR